VNARRTPIPVVRPGAEASASDRAIESLRAERLSYDDVTGLPIHPFDNPDRLGAIEDAGRLGVIYLQIGRFFGFEELYGWEQYDRVLAAVAEGLREDVAASPLAPQLLSLRYSGADGFYLIFGLPAGVRRGEAQRLEEQAAKFQHSAMRRLRQAFGGTTVDLMNVYVSTLVTASDPRVRPARHLIRTFAEAVRIVSLRQTRERRDLCAALKDLLGTRKLRAAFQPVCGLPGGEIVGYEALIRGPQGSPLEQPNVLFAVAHENDMDLELETLCLETIFSKLPRGVVSTQLFVNASANLLRHPVFLDDRHLDAMNRCHTDIVVEISEKEMVGDYASFGDVLATLRRSKIRIAVDDVGSGYSGLEAILYLRPDYIKVADSLVRGLEQDPIKREIIASLSSIARQIDATVIAEGIERPAERQALVRLGIPYGQGYLLGRPSFQASSRAR
jgi:EAL domain-containing protein (putative c-di-GMP-specific phosphodiesterase class I)/GGDEF domain-containing protein